jgi:endonuclease YncB( thermonuclease family)
MFAVLRKKAPLWGAFFVAWMMAIPAQALCPVPASVSEVAVQQVVDGDTLRLKDGRRVRLVGINAPELSGPQRTPEPYAEASRDRLRQLVAENGGRVGLLASGKDRYGRTLGHVFGRRGESLEAQLLAEGLGYFVAFAPGHAWQACQQQAESGARTARLGLWRSAAALSPERIRQGGFSLVEGRLARVEQNRGGLWLQLDGPLVLRVAPDLLAHFDVPALRALVGRKVAVRGWVVDRRRDGALARGQSRWMLLLTDPAMLQALP